MNVDPHDKFENYAHQPFQQRWIQGQKSCYKDQRSLKVDKTARKQAHRFRVGGIHMVPIWIPATKIVAQDDVSQHIFDHRPSIHKVKAIDIIYKTSAFIPSRPSHPNAPKALQTANFMTLWTLKMMLCKKVPFKHADCP